MKSNPPKVLFLTHISREAGTALSLDLLKPENRTTHNSQAVETKRFLRTGEARGRSTSLKAWGIGDCIATIGVS
jgi:hypothetical protein